MSENEVWKDVVGYEGFYKVSDRGNVFSVGRVSSIGRRIGGILLKPQYDKGGYLQVRLYKNGKRKGKLIHRLVLEAFVENPNNLPEVNHKDEIKDNNNVENLEWCTSAYNVNHGTRNKRVSKKVRAINVETGEVLAFNSTMEAGRKGYSQSGVTSACRGVYKSSNGKLIGGGNLYKGYRWYYEEENK